jgi:hypothetical protein
MAIYCRTINKKDKEEFLKLITDVADIDAWNMNYFVPSNPVTAEGYKSHINRHFEEKIDEYIEKEVIHLILEKNDDGTERILGYSKMFINGDTVDVWDTYLIPEVRDKNLSHVAWKYMSTLGTSFTAHSNPENPGQSVSHDTLLTIGFKVEEQDEKGPKTWRLGDKPKPVESKEKPMKADDPKAPDTQV